MQNFIHNLKSFECCALEITSFFSKKGKIKRIFIKVAANSCSQNYDSISNLRQHLHFQNGTEPVSDYLYCSMH